MCGPTGGLDPESFVHADLIVLWGINIVATAMHHWRFVKEARQRGEQAWQVFVGGAAASTAAAMGDNKRLQISCRRRHRQ